MKKFTAKTPEGRLWNALAAYNRPGLDLGDLVRVLGRDGTAWAALRELVRRKRAEPLPGYVLPPRGSAATSRP